MKVFKKLDALKHKYCKSLLKRPNVVGVGVGYRQKGGQETDKPSLIVFVSQKVPPDTLGPKEIVPKRLEGGGVDVIDIGEIRLLHESGPLETGEEDRAVRDEAVTGDQRKKKHRPVPGGVSVGHYLISAGTLGAMVRDKASGQVLGLSNNHVLANSTTGRDGGAFPGDPVLQPGVYDGGMAPGDVWGYLERFIPLNLMLQESFCTTARFWEKAGNTLLSLFLPAYRLQFLRNSREDNLVDAAVCRPSVETDCADHILELGKVAGTADPFPGQEVVFSGRSSGVARGRIMAVNASLVVNLGYGKQVFFAEQIVTSAIANPGDSGSLLLDTRNHAVGLLFAGSSKASISNTIHNVCRLLQVEFF